MAADRSALPFDWVVPGPTARRRTIARLQRRLGELSPEENWKLGRIHIYEGCIEEDDARLDEGVAALVEAANDPEPFPEAVLDLSWVLTMRGLSSMAIKYSKRATQLMPERRDTWAFYGSNCIDMGLDAEAAHAISTACALLGATDSDRALLASIQGGEKLSRTPHVMTLFPTAVEDLPPSSTADKEALKYRLFVMRQFLSIEPDNPYFLLDTANYRYHLGQFDQALGLLTELLRLQPDHSDAMTIIALIHQKSDRQEEAIAWYERAVEANRDNVLANTNLAKFLGEEGRSWEARKCLNRALKADPDNANALSLYGNSIARIEQDYELEATYHRRSLELDPTRPEVHSSLCLCLLEAGNFKDAAVAWRRGKRWIRTLDQRSHNSVFTKLIPHLIDPPYDLSMGELILDLRKNMNGKAFRRALERMLIGARRHQPVEERADAYHHVGMVAGHCQAHDLSLRAFLEVEKLEGRGTVASSNVAVALGGIGRIEDAIERAREVDAGTGRALTILGNLLGDSGEPEEALQCYLRSVHIDKGFLLPISRGTDIGIGLGLLDQVSDLQKALEFVADKELECAHLRARLHSARGLPWIAIDLLEPLLVQGESRTAGDGEEAEGPHDLDWEGRSDEELDTPIGDPGSADSEDLSILLPSSGPSPPQSVESGAWFLLAESYWACGRPGRAVRILNHAQDQPGVRADGNWNVLAAECLADVSQPDDAHEILSTMNPQPPPSISLALIDLASGESTRARIRAREARNLEVAGSSYHHPRGRPRALEYAIEAFADTYEDDIDKAVKNGRLGREIDSSSSFVSLSAIGALEADGEPDEALAIGLSTLPLQPGDPSLVQWCVQAHLGRGELDQADRLLQSHREFMERRSHGQTAAELGEAIAVEKLQAGGGSAFMNAWQEHEDAWPWLDELQPRTRDWLQKAIVLRARLQQMTEVVGFYLGKVAEAEIASCLIEPFKSKLAGDGMEFDRRMKDFSSFIAADGHPPGIGGCAQALQLAAAPEKPGDSELLLQWREYLASLDWEGAQNLVSRSYLKRLWRMSRTRDANSHDKVVTDKQVKQMELFMLSGDRPGDFFQALGLGTKSDGSNSGGRPRKSD